MDWNIINREIRFSTSRPSITDHQRSYLKETRVRLRFNVAASKGLTQEEKLLVSQKFDHIISSNGILAITAERDPSQDANKAYAIQRLHDMFAELLAPRAKRKTIPVRTGSEEDRIRDKRHVAARKAGRAKPMA